MKLPAKNILDRIIITGIGFQHKTNHRAIWNQLSERKKDIKQKIKTIILRKNLFQKQHKQTY